MDHGPKFVGITGHESVSHNGSKTTVYFLQVNVDGAMFVVRHRYHDFKDFADKVRVTPTCCLYLFFVVVVYKSMNASTNDA